VAEAGRFDPLLLSLGTLTALPVPPPGLVDHRTASRAMLLAPVAALVPGTAAALTGAAAAVAGLPGTAAGALAVGALALASRGLHLDGLADTADGLAASHDRDRALKVMRRGDTGPAGAAAVTLVLLLQAVLAGQLLARSAPAGAVALLVTAVVSRAGLPLGCRAGVPAARPQGLGATVAGTVPTVGVVLLLGLVALVATWATAATGRPWWTGLAATGLAVLTASAVLARCTRRFGGITGDVLGAVVEAGAVAALVGLSLG
jgi:adenosylcobinamide-GDP ribazoletransferase